MFVIISNYGDDSIALIQWAYENKFEDVAILSIDTGFSSINWDKRVKIVQNWIKEINYNCYHLKPKPNLIDQIKQRQQFPTKKFNWCVLFIKAMPILSWLDEYDQDGEATIMLANRRNMSKVKQTLAYAIEESEYYDDRKLINPLYLHTVDKRNKLIAKTPISLLAHRSFECHPCIYSTYKDFAGMHQMDIMKISKLEQELSQSMFFKNDSAEAQNIIEQVEYAKKNNIEENYYDKFSMSCSWSYGCGL